MFDLLEDRLAPAVFSDLVGPVLTPGAVRVDLDLNGQDRFVANILPRNDDGSSGQISLVNPGGFSAPINFFGPSYSSLYVNNNGNITFNGPLSTFTPFGLTGNTNVPIIAPFFADVWTFGSSGLTKYGFGTVDGHHAFSATWDHVNSYADSSSNGTNFGSIQNYFQVLLIERSDTGTGNFDIEFNYNQIQWETGSASGGVNGLGGSSARAGYSNGSGTANTFFELQGSGVNGAFLDSNTNGLIHRTASSDNVLGRYAFNVRSGFVIPTISVVAPGGVYNGSAYTATISGSSAGTPTLTYYSGETATENPLPGAPVNVGTYTVVALIAATSTTAAASISTTFSITPKELTVSGITADDKNYDGTTDATLDLESASLDGVIEGDDVSLNTGESFVAVFNFGEGFASELPAEQSVIGTFASKNVGTQTVTVSGLSLRGEQKDNYTLTQPTTSATIFAKTLTVSGITAADKSYDGTTDATLDLESATLEGVIDGDDVSLNKENAVGAFDTILAGSGKTVVVTGLTLNNNEAGNYALSQPTELSAAITRATPTITVHAANGVFNGSPFEATATVAGLDGDPNSTLEGTPVSIAYYVGTSTDGDPLAEAPTDPGLYTAVATFAGSSNYASAEARVGFLIVPIPVVVVRTPDKVVATKPFAGNENGSISTTDNTASVTVIQPTSGGTPVVVTLEHFNSVESSSTYRAPDGATIERTSDGPVTVFAKFDLKVIGAADGAAFVAYFQIPKSISSSTPLALYYDPIPDDSTPSERVPEHMIEIRDGYLIVTFTGTSSVTFHALFGTVFTITEAANLVFPLIALIAPPNQENLSNSNDILGDLLDSRGTANDGQLIGAVAPTNVSQISAPTAGRNSADVDDDERARQWLRVFDAIYLQLRRLLEPQLHLLADNLVVTEPTVFVDTPFDAPEPLKTITLEEPIFSHDNASTIGAATSSLVTLASAEESSVEISSIENNLGLISDTIAPPSRIDRRWQYIAVAVGLLWPNLVLGSDFVANPKEEKARPRLRNRLHGADRLARKRAILGGDFERDGKENLPR